MAGKTKLTPDVGRRGEMREGKWIRWMGAVASLVVLAMFASNPDVRRFFLGSEPNTAGTLFYLTFFILPAFAVVFLSAFARFWWTFSLGLWLSLFSVWFCVNKKASPTSLVLVLAIATICMTPILSRACRSKKPSTNEDGKPTNPPHSSPAAGPKR